jgi:hypothetical protein
VYGMSGQQEASTGAVRELVVNGTTYQVLALENGTCAVRGGDWAVSGCPNELAAMGAILDRVEDLQNS